MGRKRGTGEHRGKKERILELLLERDDLTTGEIAAALAPDAIRNKYDYVSTELSQLQEHGFITGGKTRQPVGAPATSWRMERQLSTVRRIFDEYPRLHRKLRETAWIRELVQRSRIPSSISKELRADLHEMLRHSPSFFEFALLRQNLAEITNRWFLSTLPTPFGDKNLIERYVTSGHVPHPFAFHTFFTLCAFLDLLKGEITAEEEEVVSRIAAKRSEDQEDARAIDRWSAGYLCATALVALDNLSKDSSPASHRAVVTEASKYCTLYDAWAEVANDPIRAAPLERDLALRFRCLMEVVQAPLLWRDRQGTPV